MSGRDVEGGGRTLVVREDSQQKQPFKNELPITRCETVSFFFLAPIIALTRFAMVAVYLTFYYYGTHKSLEQLADSWVGDNNTQAENAISGAMGFWVFEFLLAATFNGALPRLSVEGSFSHVWNRTVGLLFNRLKGPNITHRWMAAALSIGHVVNIMFWAASGARLYLLLLGQFLNSDGPSVWGNNTTPGIAHQNNTDLSNNVGINIGFVSFALIYTFLNVLWSGPRLIEGTANALEGAIQRCRKQAPLPAGKTFVGDKTKDYWPALTRAEEKFDKSLRRIMHGNRRWQSITPCAEGTLKVLRDLDQGFIGFSQVWYYWGAMTHTINKLIAVIGISDPNQAAIQAASLLFSLNTATVSFLFYITCRPELPKIGGLSDVWLRRFYTNFPRNEEKALAEGKQKSALEMQPLSQHRSKATTVEKLKDLLEQKVSEEKQDVEKSLPKKSQASSVKDKCDCAQFASVVVMAVYCGTMVGTVAFQALLFLQGDSKADRAGEYLVNDTLASILTWMYRNPGITLSMTLVREAYVLTPKAYNSYEKLAPIVRQFFTCLQARCPSPKKVGLGESFLANMGGPSRDMNASVELSL